MNKDSVIVGHSVILGWGVVGQAHAKAFGIEAHYDIDSSKSNIELKDIIKYKYIWICLPTPTINNECYTKDISETVTKLIKIGLRNDAIIIIRSTVYPGFNYDLCEGTGLKRIVSNPEFLSEDTATQDAGKPDLIVLGGEDNDSVNQIASLYKGRFKYPDPVITDSRTAEFIKYALNTFFVTKVVFCNQLYDSAQDLNANYSVVKKVLEEHKWGSQNHFDPFHKGKRGGGGRCLPKDLEAFGNLAINQNLWYYIEELNNRYLNSNNKN